MTGKQSLQERLRQKALSYVPFTNERLLYEAADAIDSLHRQLAEARTALQLILDEWELGGACCAATATAALAKLKAAGEKT